MTALSPSLLPHLRMALPKDLPTFPIDEAYLVAAWLASAFWGAFTVIFVFWMVSTIPYLRKTKHYTTTITVFVMYILATAHISIILVRIINAFIVNGGKPLGATLYLANIAEPINRSKDMIYVSLIFLGDSILVWRCFMVWNRNYYVIAFPCVMIMGTAISGYGAIAQFFKKDPYTPTGVKWATGMLVVSMATNVIVTSLTAGRIWVLARNLNMSLSSSSGKQQYRQIILLIVESGLVMTLSKTLEFTLFKLAPANGLVGLNALYIVMDCMPQIMGICPTLIILAVNLGFTRRSDTTYGSSTAGGANVVFASVNKKTVTDSSVSYPLQFIPHKEDAV